MIKEDTVIKLDDDKEYYVLDSLMKDDSNFIMIGEIDSVKEEITKNVKIMYYDIENDEVIKENAYYRDFLTITDCGKISFLEARAVPIINEPFEGYLKNI